MNIQEELRKPPELPMRVVESFGDDVQFMVDAIMAQPKEIAQYKLGLLQYAEKLNHAIKEYL